MNENQTKEYIKNLNFGLKDKQRTTDKYKDYKTEKFKAILTENKDDIDNYFLWLIDNIKNELALNPLRWDYLKLDQKKHIRHFKTLINSVTFGLNMAFIGDLETLNDNEKRNFSILFYLEFYDDINGMMKEVLSDLVLEYPKKAIVKKLSV